MDIAAKLTVFFEEPFWVGVCERQTPQGLEVAKVTFGAEPKDYEVYDYFLKNYVWLRFSPPVAGEAMPLQAQNPKRMQREIRRGLSAAGIGTKAQQALQAQRELLAQEQKARRRERVQAERGEQFALRQEKKKQKHRGR